MDKYEFHTGNGISRVIDTENGVSIEWENGRFNETDPAKIIVKTKRFYRGMGWEHEYLDGHTEETITDEWFNCEYPEGWTDKTPVIPDVEIEYHIPQKQ